MVGNSYFSFDFLLYISTWKIPFHEDGFDQQQIYTFGPLSKPSYVWVDIFTERVSLNTDDTLFPRNYE